MADGFLEVSQVVHRLNVGQEYVRRLIRNKQLTAIHLGKRWRVDPIDLQAFIDARRAHVDPRGEPR